MGAKDRTVVSFGQADSDGRWQQAHDAYVKEHSLTVSKDMSSADIAKLTEMARRDQHLNSMLADQRTGYATQDTVAQAIADEGRAQHISLMVEGHIHREATHWADVKIGTTPAKTIQVTVLAEGLVRNNPNDWDRESAAPAGTVSGTVKASYRELREWEANTGQSGKDLGSAEIPFTIPAGQTSTIIELERKFPKAIKERDNWINLDLTLANLKVEGDRRPVQAGSTLTMDAVTTYTVRPGTKYIRLQYADDAS